MGSGEFDGGSSVKWEVITQTVNLGVEITRVARARTRTRRKLMRFHGNHNQQTCRPTSRSWFLSREPRSASSGRILGRVRVSRFPSIRKTAQLLAAFRCGDLGAGGE